MLKQLVSRAQKMTFILLAILFVLSLIVTVSAMVDFSDSYKHGNGHCDKGYCEYGNKQCDQGGHCVLGHGGHESGMSDVLPK